jgi:outer membrane protein assembly factor BamB
MLALASLPLAAQAGSDDWPQFRGPEGNGVGTNVQIPAEWSSDRQPAWKVRVPGSGWSQPVIVGNRIFLTTAVSDQPWRPKDYSSGAADPHTVSGGKAPAPDVTIEWKVLAIDLQNGDLKWASTVVSGKPKYPIHPSNTYASETPAADDRGVYAWFGATGTMAALDHTGHLLWRRELGVFRQQENLGTGSSPRLHQGLLYLQCFNEEQAFVVCLDARSGREKWRISRDQPGTAWTTPLVWANEGRIELILCGQTLITSHDPLTGRELWRGSGVQMPGPSSLAADRSRLYFGFRSPLKGTKLMRWRPATTRRTDANGSRNGFLDSVAQWLRLLWPAAA